MSLAYAVYILASKLCSINFLLATPNFGDMHVKA